MAGIEEMFTYETDNWKYQSCFVIGTHVVNNKMKFLCYNPCYCQEKYTFKRQELLFQLKQLKGWAIDPEDKYTLNYIMIVVLAHFKHMGNIFYSFKLKKHLIIPDSILERGLRLDNRPYGIDELIKLIISELDQQRMYGPRPYFTCIDDQTENFIRSLLGPEGPREQYFGRHYS